MASPGPNEVLGELTVLAAAPRTASAITLEPCHLLRLEQEVVYQLIANHVRVAKELIGGIIRRIRQRTEEN